VVVVGAGGAVVVLFSLRCPVRHVVDVAVAVPFPALSAGVLSPSLPARIAVWF
jgi:hypothetical protein